MPGKVRDVFDEDHGRSHLVQDADEFGPQCPLVGVALASAGD